MTRSCATRLPSSGSTCRGCASPTTARSTALQKTGVPGPEGSVAKLHWSETNQRLTSLAQSLSGLAGQLDGEGGVWDGYWAYLQLRSRGNTIEAGTSEILRNIIAERVVGLPRSR